MSWRIIAVGKIKEKYLQDGIDEYNKRVSGWMKVEVKELKTSSSNRSREEALQEEGSRILKSVRPGSYVVVLTAEGEQFSSPALAQKIDDLLSRGIGRFDIIIGSYQGLAPEVKRRADLLLSLSTFTFSSQLSRLILMEQLFRIMKIIKNEPYHR